MESGAGFAAATDDDDYDWSAAVAEIERIHQAGPPASLNPPGAFYDQEHITNISSGAHPIAPWSRELAPRVPVHAVQRPLTSYFECGPAQRAFGEARADAQAEQARKEEEEQPVAVPIDPDAAATWIYPCNVSRREYQYQIVARALYENVLVCLPTGLGKTFIAAVLMYNYFRWFPKGKVIFLAPTKPLVNQQVEACYGIMGIPQESTAEMTGAVAPTVRKGLWQEKRVFFLTPQTLEQDLYTGICPRKSVVLIVMDEAHRATGNYSYCNIVREMQSVNARYRVLALTATPGSDFNAIQNVINNLGISRLEHRGEDHAEVAMYTHAKEKILVPVEMDKNSQTIRTLFYEVIRPMLARLCSLGGFYNKDVTQVTAWQIHDARTRFMAAPPARATDASMRECGNLFTILHSLYFALQLLSSDGANQSFKYLEGKLEDNALLRGHRTRDGNFAHLLGAMHDLVRRGAPAPKLLKLEEILTAHFEAHDAAKTRVIIFSERRESVKDINEMLKERVPAVRSTEFKGQASGKNNKGQSQKRQQAVLKEFREGAFNVIVSTSIGEEGLDIGEVDLVVCFDASASPLRMIQRMGRTGRKRQGRVMILAAVGKEIRDYEKNQAKMRSVQKKMQNGGQDFEKHTAPRMVPHAFRPEMRSVIMDIPEYIHRGNKTVRTPMLVDPGTEELGTEELATLARWHSPGPWSPSLIAFSNFQSQPSKVHKIRHGPRATELFVGVLQRLQIDPLGAELLLEVQHEGDVSRDGDLGDVREDGIDVRNRRGSADVSRDTDDARNRRGSGDFSKDETDVRENGDSGNGSEDSYNTETDIFAIRDRVVSKKGTRQRGWATTRRREKKGPEKVAGGEPPGALDSWLDAERRAERAGPGPSSVRLQSADGVRFGRHSSANFEKEEEKEEAAWGGTDSECEQAGGAEEPLPWSPPKPAFTPEENVGNGCGVLRGTEMGDAERNGDCDGTGRLDTLHDEGWFGNAWYEQMECGDTWQEPEAPGRCPEGDAAKDGLTLREENLTSLSNTARVVVEETRLRKEATTEALLPDSPEPEPTAPTKLDLTPQNSIEAEQMGGGLAGLPQRTVAAAQADKSSNEASGDEASVSRLEDSLPGKAEGLVAAAQRADKSSDEASGDESSASEGSEGSSDGEGDCLNGSAAHSDAEDEASHRRPEVSTGSLEGLRGEADWSNQKDYAVQDWCTPVKSSDGKRTREMGGEPKSPQEKRIKITPKRSRAAAETATEQPGGSAGRSPEKEKPGAGKQSKPATSSQTSRPLADLPPNVGHGDAPRAIEDLPLGAHMRSGAGSPGVKLRRAKAVGGGSKRGLATKRATAGGESLTSRALGKAGGETPSSGELQEVAGCARVEGPVVEVGGAAVLGKSEAGKRTGQSAPVGGAELDGKCATDTTRVQKDCSDDECQEDVPLASRLRKKQPGKARKRAEKEQRKKDKEDVPKERGAGKGVGPEHRKKRGRNVAEEATCAKAEGQKVETPKGARAGTSANGSMREVSEALPVAGDLRLNGGLELKGVETTASRDQTSNQVGGKKSETMRGTKIWKSIVPSQKLSSQRAAAPVATCFDADTVVPDSESEDDTWHPVRAHSLRSGAAVGRFSSQRSAGNGMENGKGPAKEGVSSIAQTERCETALAQVPDKQPVDDPGCEPRGPSDQQKPGLDGRSLEEGGVDSLKSKASGRAPSPGFESPQENNPGMVPESPDSETRALHALSSQIQSPIAYGSPGCQVPETPESEKKTGVTATVQRIATSDGGGNSKRIHPEESGMAKDNMRNPEAALEADAGEAAAKAEGEQPSRAYKPVPFPGFSPLLASSAQPRPLGSFSGVVPETPESALPYKPGSLQQNGVNPGADLKRTLPFGRSPVLETPPMPSAHAGTPYQGPGVNAGARWGQRSPLEVSPVPETPPSFQLGAADPNVTVSKPDGLQSRGDSMQGPPAGRSPVRETPPDSQPGAFRWPPAPYQTSGVKLQSDLRYSSLSERSPDSRTPPEVRSAAAVQNGTPYQLSVTKALGDTRPDCSPGWSPFPNAPPEYRPRVDETPQSLMARPAVLPDGSLGRYNLQAFGSPHQGSSWQPRPIGGVSPAPAPSTAVRVPNQNTLLAPIITKPLFGRPGHLSGRAEPLSGCPGPLFEDPRGHKPPGDFLRAESGAQSASLSGRASAECGQNGNELTGSQRNGSFPPRKPLPRVFHNTCSPSQAQTAEGTDGLSSVIRPGISATCPPSAPPDNGNRPISTCLRDTEISTPQSQWQRLNASLRDQSVEQNSNQVGLSNLVRTNPGPVEVPLAAVPFGVTTAERNGTTAPVVSQGPFACAHSKTGVVADSSHLPNHPEVTRRYHLASNETSAPYPLSRPLDGNTFLPASYTASHPGVNPPQNLDRDVFTSHGNEMQPGLGGLVAQPSPISHRSSGEWLPTTQFPTGPPCVEPPRKLKRLRKAGAATDRNPARADRNGPGTESVTDRNETETEPEVGPGRKKSRREAMQSLLKDGKGRGRNLASVFFDEEAEVSGDEANSSDESGDGPEEDDSFIDDRSQATASAAAATPSEGTEASPGDMMALYRRSLLTQSPLEDAAPLRVPRFKSPPRAQANKNFGKMVYLPGRVPGEPQPTASEEAGNGSPSEDYSQQSEREIAAVGNRDDVSGAAGHVGATDWMQCGLAAKKRRLGFAEPQDGNSWGRPSGPQGGYSERFAAGGYRGPAVHPAFHPPAQSYPHHDQPANAANMGTNFLRGAPIGTGGGWNPASVAVPAVEHVAACADDTWEDDFLEGLDLDRIEAEALATRTQQPPVNVSGSFGPGKESSPLGEVTTGNSQAQLTGGSGPGFAAPGHFAWPDARVCPLGNSASSTPVGGELKATNNPALSDGIARVLEPVPSRMTQSYDRVRKRRSREEDDSMPSFDLGFD